MCVRFDFRFGGVWERGFIGCLAFNFEGVDLRIRIHDTSQSLGYRVYHHIKVQPLKLFAYIYSIERNINGWFVKQIYGPFELMRSIVE